SRANRSRRSGLNLNAPEAITLVGTVTMATLAVMVPWGVSTVGIRLVSIEIAGVDSWIASPWASEASNAPKPGLQNAAVRRVAALAKSNDETCARSLPQL